MCVDIWCITEQQNCWGWEEPSDPLVHSPSSARASWSRLPRTVSSPWTPPRWTLHHLSGKPVLCHPHNRKLFPDVQKKLPVFQFVPFTPCAAAGHHWKPGSVFRALSIQVIFTHQQELPWAFSPPGWTVSALLACPHRKQLPVPLSSQCSPGCCQLPLLQGHTAGSCPPGPQAPSLPSCFLSAQPQTD